MEYTTSSHEFNEPIQMESATSSHEFNEPIQTESAAPQELDEPIQVDPVIRWDIYYRLLELSIPCSCDTGEPLRVSVQDALTAIQLWSVMKQTTAPRDEQVEWLNACWGV